MTLRPYFLRLVFAVLVLVSNAARPETPPDPRAEILKNLGLPSPDESTKESAPTFEQKQIEEKTSTNKPLTLTLLGGIMTGASTEQFYNASSGQVLGSGSNDGSGSWFAGADLSYSYRRTGLPLGLGLITQYSQYKYQNGSKPDKHFSLMLLPKLQSGGKNFSLWIGPVTGIMFTTIGTSSATAGGATLAASSDKATSTMYGGKAGGEYWIDDKFFIGLEAAYLAFSYTVYGSLTSGSSVVTGSAEYSRSWWQIGARIGMGL
jgi:hypothetical protein